MEYTTISIISRRRPRIFPPKKISFFVLTSLVNIENIFSLEPFFGRAFHKEKLEGLILFINTSDYDVLLVRLDISLTIDERHETKTKNRKYF